MRHAAPRRGLIGWSLLGWLFALAPLAAAEKYPYTAYVQTEKADVRSGPGDEYYPTDRLAWGQTVEVFRAEDDQWVAIRPPEGSFSWLPTSAVARTDSPALVRVIDPQAVTRVGTVLGPQRHVEYIRLDRDELLEVLGERFEQGSEPQSWLKIAPVVGEFRWMRAEDLGRRPPRDGFPDSHATSSSAADEGPANLSEGRSSIPTSPLDATNGTPTLWADSDASDVTTDGQWRGRGQPTPAVSTASLETPVSATVVENEEPDPQSAEHLLSAIDLDLSRIAALPVGSWDMQSLKARLEELQALGLTADQHRRLTQLQERVNQFRSVQQRYHQVVGKLAASSAGAERPSAPRPLHTVSAAPLRPTAHGGEPIQPASADVPINDGSAEPTEPLDTPRPVTQHLYDAQGWLMPVFTRRTDVPQYVLTDDQGRVLQFVSAVSGLNLRRYQRHQVGIIGDHVALANLRKPHVVARRIVLLDRPTE